MEAKHGLLPAIQRYQVGAFATACRNTLTFLALGRERELIGR